MTVVVKADIPHYKHLICYDDTLHFDYVVMFIATKT